MHAFYDIAVTPGDRTVRRKADQLVTAQLLGFDAPKVRLFAQYRRRFEMGASGHAAVARRIHL